MPLQYNHVTPHLPAQSPDMKSDCAMAKLVAVRVAIDVASGAIGLMGGAGLTEV